MLTHLVFCLIMHLQPTLSQGSTAAGMTAGSEQLPSYDITYVKLASEQTVVLILASTCDECMTSMAFYHRLRKMPGMDGKRKKLVVFALDGVWPVKDILDTHGFRPHRLISYPTNSRLDAHTAPSLLVYNQKAALIGKWIGQLRPTDEDAVMALLK